jgi:hypothetical protein
MATLGAGANCKVTVKFAPTYLGPKTASVQFSTDGGNPSVAVKGIGTASGMVLYPSPNTKPTRQINVFGGSSGPINVDNGDYSHLIGVGTGILNRYSAGTYITGVTSSLDLGCTGASCTGSSGTYLDHVGSGGLGGGACPSLVYDTGSDSIDEFVNNVAVLGYINNLILVNASYGGGASGNTATPQYVWTQNWADYIDNDCANRDGSLSWVQGSYLPGDYLYESSNYWQMTQSPCTNTDTNDIRCQTGATKPNFAGCGATCADGSANWTKMTTGHAPPQDGFCNSTYPGSNCAYLVLSGAASVTSNVATVTVTAQATYAIGQVITVANASVSAYNCATNSCTVTGVSNTTPWTVSYNLTTSNRSGDTLTNNGNGCTAQTSPAGCTLGAHSLNINTLTASPYSMSTTTALNLLQTTLPVPWEQPIRQRLLYIFSQIHAHYKNSIGYVRLGLTKGGESAQDGISGWPSYSTHQYTSYEKLMYTYEGLNGCGTDFACVGNLNMSPSVEAGYMNSNNVGFDNNALQSDHVYTIYENDPTVPAATTLFHGGDWALEFSTYNAAQSNGYYPVTTVQSTTAGTPGTCNTGTCSATTPFGCTTVGVNGAMSSDSACTTAPFNAAPFTSGFPGNLRAAKLRLANNNELYFCDALLGLDDGSGVHNYANSSCNQSYSQSTYKSPYQTDFMFFLAP